MARWRSISPQDSADIDALPPHPGDTAYTALGHAIEEGGHRMIQLLLKFVANPNSADIHDDVSSSAFTFALENTCSLGIIDLQLKYGPGFNNLIGKESALETAVEVGQADVVRRIMTLMSQYCPEHYSRSLKTIMSHMMIDNDWAPDFEMVRTLIDAGADINAAYIDDDNPLYHGTLLQRSVRQFVSGSRISVVQLLLDNGAEINTPATDNLGTPLQLAILDEEVEIANLLIDHGADVNVHPAKNRGATALQAAALHGYCGLSMRSLAKGADVAAPAAPIDGRLAIDGAAEHGYLDMVQLLLNAYGDRPSLSFVYRRAAAAAEREGHFDVMRWLLGYIQS
ncbi:ankyrin [Aspergillus costaricaensis CBS 115574]|uniref:Ankyrin n=1 Tax=Aspergillus costaricaensis CBS 115574 TaxID=1448317 RepID=A0ACD1I3Y6_9EURO|nr:ankyrin [Aspergillus costaricaensis CBS 115574]RAK85205.1 ankyrin [Aspergillus costaricaensis CBS 115574]